MDTVKGKLEKLFNHSEPYSTNIRPDDVDPYTALDVCGTGLIFNNVSNEAGSDFVITGVCFEIDVNALPSGMAGFRLHLYDAAPTVIADNAAFNLPVADRSKYLGYIDIDTPIDMGDTLYVCMNNINFKRKLKAGSKDIYGTLQTINAFTPSRLTVKTVKLHVLGV